MMYDYLCREARSVSSQSLARPLPPLEWERTLNQRREQWREMLGLAPLPERTPLQATVTGVLGRGEYVVEKLHFQPLPGAFVAGNLYRPATANGRLPAVLYLCGHSKGKVNPPYQANPRWFGQHGYIALVLDPIQLGECQGFHHGTYHGGRWDWYSRGYTPAGTEVWNAMRALDYLAGRDDVDADRLGVTGLSGGGAISWFLGAADERVKCVVPVCQTGTIEHLITDRATDGHCDCAFWINYYRWCTPDLGGLIAPRPLLIAAGSEDVLWRPFAFRDAFHRIHHQYAALGVADRVALVEDLTPHGYTPKLRQAIFSWFNRYLKGDDAPVTDDVTGFVEPEANLLVFAGKPPADDAMRRVDQILVAGAEPFMPGTVDQWRDHQRAALARLRGLTFRYAAAQPAPRVLEHREDGTDSLGQSSTGLTGFGSYTVGREDGPPVRVRTAVPAGGRRLPGLVAFALPPETATGFAGCSRARPRVREGVATAGIEVRNSGASSVGPGYLWTLRRSYPLLGQTLAERQVADLLAGVAFLSQAGFGPIALYGEGYTAVLAIYAALLDADVSEVILTTPPVSHQSPETPELLGVLRLGDLPANLALLWPRSITFVGGVPAGYEWTRQLYARLGKPGTFRMAEAVSAWSPMADA